MISKRLKSLEKYLNRSNKVIDIGCDHALLDIDLIKNNILDDIIVSDIHEKALNQGIENIKFYKLESKIYPRLGNGLEVLKESDEVDTILISGMGTSTILSIIDNEYFEHINKLVIQSNNDHEILRRELIDKGFIISNEEFIKDSNKVYINIVFERGSGKYTNLEIKYGPFLKNNKEYLDYRLDYLNKILNKIPNRKIFIRGKIKSEIKLIKKLEKNL